MLAWLTEVAEVEIFVLLEVASLFGERPMTESQPVPATRERAKSVNRPRIRIERPPLEGQCGEEPLRLRLRK